MREKIIAWGGEVHFHSQMTDIEVTDGSLTSITIESDGQAKRYPAQTLVLAIGHSARDTFSMLYEKKLPLKAKSFAVGVRVEHRQLTINDSQYGKDSPYHLPAAAYKVTANLEDGRGVYSFCMCPGGVVVPAMSEEGTIVTNGMSYNARDGVNSNSVKLSGDIYSIIANEQKQRIDFSNYEESDIWKAVEQAKSISNKLKDEINK